MQQLADERWLIKEAAHEFTMKRVLPLNEHPRVAKPEHRFGNECVDQPSPFSRWATDAAPCAFGEFFDAYPLQVWIRHSNLGVSVPTCSRIAGINSCWVTFQRCMIISSLVLFIVQALRCRFG